MKKESNFKNLYKKIDATSKTRFNSSRRLSLHSKLSTYSVVFISLSLILIALMQVFKIGANIQSPYIGLIQVFASITVLVYSLLIDKNDYSNLSEKMYSCASKLGKLKQDIYPYIENRDDKDDKNETLLKIYTEFKQKYDDILELYETHSINDFKADYKIARFQMVNNFPLKWYNYLFSPVNITFNYLINFMSYILLFLIFSFVMIWITIG